MNSKEYQSVCSFRRASCGNRFFFGIDLRRRRRRHNKETGNGGLTTRLNADVGASLLISIEIGECVEYFVAVVVFGWNSRRVASHGGTFEFGVWCFFFFSFLFFFVILGFCSSVHRVPPEIRWVSRFQIGNFFVRGVFVFFFNLDRTAAPTTCSHKNKIERNRLEAETIT